MACTTILIGKGASYDGSTMVARNEDSGAGSFIEKKKTVVLAQDQPRHYQSVLSHVKIDLPDNPMTYTVTPDALGKDGIYGAFGVNQANVAMSATETITSNARVLGADPLVEYHASQGQPGQADYVPEQVGGIGEEDFVTLVLPYIKSARQGVVRLGGLLEEFGTYEMNGIAFQDKHEIWWLETVGGHHWIAKRVPDDAYVMMPNQLGIDQFDLEDAFGAQNNHLCSADLKDFIQDHHLDLGQEGDFNPRWAFGSQSDADHVYNTPRAWVMGRYFNGKSYAWDGPQADFGPDSDNIPWALVPDRKITIEDVKTILSNHYQGTPYDVYDKKSSKPYRPIGINRNNVLGLIQIRPYVAPAIQAIEWLAFGSNPFNALIPFYANVKTMPSYLSQTNQMIRTDNIYWANRLIAALADPHYQKALPLIERYQLNLQAQGHAHLHKFDGLYVENKAVVDLCQEANQAMADLAKAATDKLLDQILFLASNRMQNSFHRSDG